MAKITKIVDKNESDIKLDLKFLGQNYQQELVKCFIEDHQFFMSIEHIVDQNMFTDDTLRRIMGLIKSRYDETGTVATYRDLDILARTTITDVISVERVIATLLQLKEMELGGIDIIQRTATKFFRQQNLIKAVNKVQEIIKNGDQKEYDKIEDIVKEALKINDKQDLGYGVFDNMEAALQENYRCAIPTGADKLDEALYGGLGKGELGIIIAPSSVGKTSATTGFAATAAITKTDDNNYQGYKVLHIHFEDEDYNMKRKYYAFLTGFDAGDLHLPNVRPYALDIINKHDYKSMIDKNVRLLHPLSGEMSPTDIKNKIKQFIASGFKPDIVVIDYFECLKLESGTRDDKEYTREGITMRKLEAIAHDFNVALWCPVQGTKDSFNQQVVGLSQAGGSVKKVQIGHVIISFARTEEMRLHDKINIFINKFRPGRIKVNQFLNVTFNNGTTKFDFSSTTDIDNALDSGQTYQQNISTLIRDNQRRY